MRKNAISYDLTDEDVTLVTQKIDEIEAVLPFLINLSPDDRKGCFKMGEKSTPFVEKALEYVETFPELKPPFADIGEIQRDFSLALKLKRLYRRFQPLVEKLEDTYIAAGTEAFSEARGIYNFVKAAAKADVPGTDVIEADLKKRFKHASKPSVETAESTKVKSKAS